MSRLDSLGLATYRLPLSVEARIVALPRNNSNDPLPIDEAQWRHDPNRNTVKRHRFENKDEPAKERLGRVLS